MLELDRNTGTNSVVCVTHRQGRPSGSMRFQLEGSSPETSESAAVHNCSSVFKHLYCLLACEDIHSLQACKETSKWLQNVNIISPLCLLLNRTSF